MISGCLLVRLQHSFIRSLKVNRRGNGNAEVCNVNMLHYTYPVTSNSADILQTVAVGGGEDHFIFLPHSYTLKFSGCHPKTKSLPGGHKRSLMVIS